MAQFKNRLHQTPKIPLKYFPKQNKTGKKIFSLYESMSDVLLHVT